MESNTIHKKVEEAARELGGTYVVSWRGVPLIEMMNPFRNGVHYSVCYFNRTKVWGVFEGYKSFQGTQKRYNFPSLSEVKTFFEQRRCN